MPSSSATCARPGRWPEALLAGALAALAAGAAPAQELDVVVCKGCHGTAGEGRPAAGYPPLAGQPALYLRRQLDAFADGRRESHVMEPLASRLSQEQRARFAQYFAARVRPVARPGSVPAESPERGRTLAEVGDNALRVQACANCHGPGGRGSGASAPWLAGQDPAYLVAQMQAWKSGRRRSDPSGAMAVIARNLPAEDIRAVAAHYASLPR